MASVLPIPPTGTPYLDANGVVTQPWQRYLLSLENALATNVAPKDAQYWVSTSNAELTNERNIGLLATGYLKVTTAAAIAVPSTVTAIPAADISGTLGADHGGTGLATYVVGDLVYASGTTALSRLADVATGNALLSGGTSTAPAYGKVGLTTHVSGTLPIANGGTNSAAALSGSSIAISNGSAIVQGAAGTTATVLHGNAAGAPSYGAVALATEVSGTLPIANGGTGAINPKVIIATDFADAARLTETVVAGGVSTFDAAGVTLNTSATISSSIKETWGIVQSTNGGGLFTTFPGEFSVNLAPSTIGTDLQVFVGLGNITVGGAGITYTSNHIGFKVVRAASGSTELFATQADGTETASSALTTLAASDQLDLACLVAGAASVSYWWRKNGSAWSAATTLTTHVPATASSSVAFAISNAGVATASAIIVRSASYSR